MENALLFKISEIKKSGGLNTTVTINPDKFENSILTSAKIKELIAKITFYIGENSIFMEGTLCGKIILNCSRCLREFDYSVEENFHQTYSFSEEIIDLVPILSEILTMSEPIKPLCNDKCRIVYNNKENFKFKMKFFNTVKK